MLTKRAKICVFGTPISLTYPHRLAEEYAMLDVMSGGRLECAFPLGTGMEYWVNPLNPSRARERFRESMEVLMQAWTQPGPTRWDGEFYHYKYLNPFPLNTGEVLKRYERVLVPEINLGQLLQLVRAQFLVDAVGYNRMRGLPLRASEVADAIGALV